jgi:CheY-like chemotaxis protein
MIGESHSSSESSSVSNDLGLRVLIVEDVDTTRQRIADLLRTHGYAVEEAVDGFEALAKVSATHFDAILLDLVLPRVNGWEFRATQLRSPQLAQIPTIVMTVHPLHERERYALRSKQVVHKPFENVTLLQAVKCACATAPGVLDLSDQLYWSRRGEIACIAHRPAADSRRWRDEQWTAIPPLQPRQVVYQCQHCAGHRGPIRRTARTQREKD